MPKLTWREDDWIEETEPDQPCQWKPGDTCIALLNGTKESAVNAYVLEVRVRDRVLLVMHGWGDQCHVLFEWCHSRKGK